MNRKKITGNRKNQRPKENNNTEEKIKNTKINKPDVNLPRILMAEKCMVGSTSTSVRFAYASVPTKTPGEKKNSLFHDSPRTCREEAAAFIRRCLHPRKDSDDVTYEVETGKSRLVVFMPINKDEKEIIRAVHMINIISDKYGIPKTNIYNVKYRTERPNTVKAYMLMGPKFWIASSHYASLYMLIIRICINAESKDFDEIENYDDVLKVLKEYSGGNRDRFKCSQNMSDANFAKLFMSVLNFILEYQDMLLGKEKVEDIAYSYSRKHLGGKSGFNEGISALVGLTSADKPLLERYTLLLSAHKNEKLKPRKEYDY